MKWFFLSMAIALFASKADAQDISIHMDEIGAGSYVIYQENGKAYYTHVLRGKTGRNYIYDLVPGKDPNGARSTRYIRDSSGQQLQKIFLDGRKIVFEPHNCQRTISVCQFTEIGKGYRKRKLRINTPIKGGFKFEIYKISDAGARILLASGKVRLDAMGMMKNGFLVPSGAPKQRHVQKRAVYQ